MSTIVHVETNELVRMGLELALRKAGDTATVVYAETPRPPYTEYVR